MSVNIYVYFGFNNVQFCHYWGNEEEHLVAAIQFAERELSHESWSIMRGAKCVAMSVARERWLVNPPAA